MRIACLGGGPAGLYFAILQKKVDPSAEITIFERNRADDTFGWGVVFSEETLGYLGENDPETADEIQRRFAHWTDIEVRVAGERFRSGGHGFCGIMRKELLGILQRRAAALGVRTIFQTEIAEPDQLMAGHDLVLAADGVNSFTRNAFADRFQPTIERRRNKYIWFGATRAIPHFLFSFRDTPHGLFWVHAYPFDGQRSTFIVECTPETWASAGLDQADEAASVAFCEATFADDLEGARLMSNRSAWINFPNIRCQRWSHDNLVIAGDAAHTAHFSIGSGTKLAMEDAIALVAALDDHPRDVPAALAHYEALRRPEVERLQRAAGESLAWFETIERYRAFAPTQFAFSLMNRSKKVTHGNLKLRDASFVAQVDGFVAGRAAAQADQRVAPGTPPMFTPFRLRDLTLVNRVVVSPMCQYSAEEGTPNDWHMVHLGARAMGGAGLVYTEMTNVAADARITPGCTGIYTADHVAAWRRITGFIHANTAARICLQLGHAGRKGATKLMWDGYDAPLDAGGWPLISASPIAWDVANQVPREMTRADMDRVTAEFTRATGMALEAGFDMVEVHMAHGYLLSSFLSPLTNIRQDGYGGPIANRLRYPLEVFRAVRAAWPARLPVAARISATDWAEGGLDQADRMALALALKEAGCDLIDVSAGQTVPFAKPVYSRCFQTPFADEIRNGIGIATMAVGAISHWDEVNSIIAGGRADLCALARPHLADPHWTLRAAGEQGWTGQPWPKQYASAQSRPPRPLDPTLVRPTPPRAARAAAE
jgi:anthraniloyl-CoA monooxygenase